MKNVIDKTDNLIKKNPIVFIIILFFVVIFIIVGTLSTYAYFTANVQGEGKQITLSTSNAQVIFTDSSTINETGITPGWSISKTFYINNTANGSLVYKLNWKYLVNNFSNREYLKYTITSNNGGGVLASTQVPDSEDHINIINNITIPGNTTQTYTITITYEDHGQGNADINKSLVGKLEITDLEGNSIPASTSSGTQNAAISNKSNLYGVSLGALMKEVYPVGSIYTSTNSTNPSELFPGTIWEVYGTGRTLVGVGTGTDSEGTQKSFAIGSTGGTKDAVIPYHRHGLNGDGAKAGNINNNTNNGIHTHNVSGSTATSSGAHTHTISANQISLTISNAEYDENNTENDRTIETALPDEVTGEYEDGVNYGEHYHTFSATGQTNATTTGSGTAHTHGFDIPSLDTTSGGNHTHTTTPVANGTLLSDAILNENTPSSSPTTTPGRQLAKTDEGLIIGPVDDYGDNTFYFRGNIEDNYVSFAGKIWRIIRINGDGSIRMIYSENTGSKVAYHSNATTTDYATAISWLTYANTPVKTVADIFYSTNIGNNSKYDQLVATTKFCNELNHSGTTKPIGFGAYSRITDIASSSPSLKCQNSNYINNLKVGLITIDEAAFAGGRYFQSDGSSDNSSYYLYSNYYYWTMTPSHWVDSGIVGNFSINNTGQFGDAILNAEFYVRPVISLKSTVTISGGNGTSSSPFVVNGMLPTTETESSHTHTIAANAITSNNPSAYTTASSGAHSHSMKNIWSNGSGSSSAYTMKSNRTLSTRYTAYNGGATSSSYSHSHTIAANGITVTNSSAITVSEESSHTHPLTIPALSVASSGAHTHTTTAKTGLTTGAGSAHTHNIPSLRLASNIVGNTSSDNHAGAHTHQVSIPSITSKNTAKVRIPTTGTDGTHTHAISGTTSESETHTHTLSGYSAYAGTSGNVTNANLQPYVTVYMWRRTS